MSASSTHANPAPIARATHPRAPTSRRRAIVLLVCLGMFMTTLDASIVNIGLPSIARAFRTPLSGPIEWVIIGYLVIIAALLLTFGRLSDLVGRTPLWIAGLAVFTIGSAVCGAAPSLGLLIGARGIQGVGSALILATSTAIIADAVPSTERGRALGWSGAAVALGTMTGPTMGGLLTQSLSWRWIFYVNVPIGLAAIAATMRIMPREAQHGRKGFDPAGALLLAIGVAALDLGLSFGDRWGWASPRLIGMLALGFGALGGTVLVDRRASNALLDLALLRNRVFVLALVSLICAMMAIFAVGFLLPFYYEELRGFSTARAGSLMTPYPVAYAIVAPIAGALADRFGSRWLAPLGLAIGAGALALLAQLDADSSTWDIVWRLGVGGLGIALFMTPNTRTLMAVAPVPEEGEASGLLATARIIGQSLSVAVAGAVLTTLGGAAAGSRLFAVRAARADPSATDVGALQRIFLNGFHAALLTCAAFAAAGALAALVRARQPRATGLE